MRYRSTDTNHWTKAIYHFWVKVGQRMHIKAIPDSLEKAEEVVEEYVESDNTSADTLEGRRLSDAITGLLCQFVPSLLW